MNLVNWLYGLGFHDQQVFSLIVVWLLILTVLAVHAWWKALS